MDCIVRTAALSVFHCNPQNLPSGLLTSHKKSVKNNIGQSKSHRKGLMFCHDNEIYENKNNRGHLG